MTVSNRIQALVARIKELDLRQNRLAEISGLDKATISGVLKGHRDPWNSTVERLERAVAQEEDRLRHALGPTGSEAA